MTNQEAYYFSPIGILQITGNEFGILSILFVDFAKENSKELSENLQNCLQQLDEYFAKKRINFDVKLHLVGTDFQIEVWKELQQISFGETISYIEQSKKMKKVSAIRAIASANGKNPVSIIVPCHRVIGKDGSLTGYMGGLWRKKWLLEHENPSQQTSLF